MKVVLAGTVGSHAYGTNTPDSDIDTLGIFVQPTRDVVGLFWHDKKETVTRTDGEDKVADPDYTYHEVRKYIRLAAKGNPTVMELIWLPQHTVKTWEGILLVDNRRMFLSQNIRDSYAGYAKQQFHRLKNRGDFSSTLKNRTLKHARHCVRLLLQCEQALTECEMTVRMTEEQKTFSLQLAQLAVEDIDAFEKEIMPMFDHVDNLPSDLPAQPDMNYLNEMLIKIRQGNP